MAGYQEVALRSLSRLPAFSPILNRLVGTLGQQDVSFSEIATLIEKDTVLTGQILRLVNSAAYGRGGTINSVRHAVSMLGITKLRNSVLGFSISQLWIRSGTAPGWSTARFNLHSIATGILADLLAQRTQVNYPEGAFVGGVLHDLGQLVIALSLPEEYARISLLHGTLNKDLRECECDVLGFSHDQLGAAALERWNLPEPIREAVAHHHDPGPITPGKPQLAHLLRAADLTVNHLGISILIQHADSELGESYPQLDELSLGPYVSRILVDFRTEFDAIRGFF